MRALYTLLLGNPFLRTPMGTEASTRFKIWWRMCGSAVENAAKQHTQWRKNEIAALEKFSPRIATTNGGSAGLISTAESQVPSRRRSTSRSYSWRKKKMTRSPHHSPMCWLAWRRSSGRIVPGKRPAAGERYCQADQQPRQRLPSRSRPAARRHAQGVPVPQGCDRPSHVGQVREQAARQARGRTSETRRTDIAPTENSRHACEDPSEADPERLKNDSVSRFKRLRSAVLRRCFAKASVRREVA